jgi:ABC-type multidrug transport system ATPase subunit
VTALVEARDVAFTYAQPARREGRAFGVSGVTFAIEPGEIFGVIGPNSAGKTTLLRLLTRVLEPARGRSGSTAGPSPDSRARRSPGSWVSCPRRRLGPCRSPWRNWC